MARIDAIEQRDLNLPTRWKSDRKRDRNNASRCVSIRRVN